MALGFATADLGRARSLLQRRGLAVAQGDRGGAIDVALAATHGTGISLVERAPGSAQTGPLPPADAERDEIVSGLDHVVIRSPNPERAVALFAGRLGLSLRLDRTEPAWGARLLFFRCGDLVVEVAHDLKAGVSDGPDRLWGVSWRVADIGKGFEDLQPSNVARRSFATPATDRDLGSPSYCEQTVTAWVRTDVTYADQCEEAEIDTRNGLLASDQTPAHRASMRLRRRPRMNRSVTSWPSTIAAVLAPNAQPR